MGALNEADGVGADGFPERGEDIGFWQRGGHYGKSFCRGKPRDCGGTVGGDAENRWQDYPYEQIAGDLSTLRQFPDGCFDRVICHNVLEYIDDKEAVIRELARVLKPGGELSVMKHNRYGRVMQTAVLLDDVDKANELLDGKDSMASKFGAIRYYEDEDIPGWEPTLCIEKVYGIRTFWDLQQNQEKHGDEDWQKRMMQLEMRVAEMDAFRRIAFFHHLMLKKH